MSEATASVRLKLARARVHLESFRSLSKQLSNDNNQYGREEYNHELGQYEFHVQDQWNISDDFAVVAGELLYDARSALEHLAHALARKPNRKTGFPIFKSKQLFDCYAASTMRTMKASAKATIEDFQPYQGARGLKSLWWLHELNNTDKHRALLVIALNFEGVTFTGGFPSDVVFAFPRERLMPGMAFMTAKAPFDGQTHSYLPNGRLVFDEGAVAPYNWPAETILSTILDDIEIKLLRAFGPSEFP